jgi:hypothetical protein
MNPGPGVETEIMRVLCSGCDRILKPRTQCNTCGRWFHNSCGNVKAQVAESGKWVCDKCRSERLRVLEEKLQDVLHQTDALTRKNKTLGDQLRLAADGRKPGRSDNVQGHAKDGERLVLGDSIIRSVGTECPDLRIGRYSGIRTEQLQRVIEKRDHGSPDALVIHVGTDDIKRTGNLDHVMGDVYDVINMAKTKFTATRVVFKWYTEKKRRVVAANWSSEQQTGVSSKYISSDLFRRKLLGGRLGL